MPDFNNSLASFVGAELDKPVQKINKDDLKETILNVITRMTTIENLLAVLPASDLSAFTQKINDGMKDHYFLGLYTKITLQFKKPDDRKYAFAGFINTARSFNQVFNSALRLIEEIVKTREITILNAKLSHAALFGLLKQADMFADYTMILFNGVLSEVIERNGVTELEAPSNAYRAKLEAGIDNLVNVVNNCSVIGPSSMQSIIKNIAFADDTLVDSNKKPNLLVKTDSLSMNQKNFIQYGLGAMSYIFRMIGQWKNVYRANAVMKARKEQEWMRERVSLLQMDLAGIDPDSKQYRDTVKVIEQYNKMVDEIQKKIDKYEAN